MSLAKGHLLTTGTASDPLLPKLVHAINNATSIDICVSFAQKSGVALLFEPLAEALESGAQVRIMTSDYLYITHPQALRMLLLLQQQGADVRLFTCTEQRAFHLKSYIFVRERSSLRGDTRQNPEAGTAFVGSSNLSASALTSGHEWNLRFDLLPDSPQSWNEFQHIRRSFDELFYAEQALALTWQQIEIYTDLFEQVTQQNAPLAQVLGVDDVPEPERYTPNEAQTEALLALQETRRVGYQRGLVVLGTGMGKTWLAAFDVQQMNAKRVLFVAHREEILLQAQRTFSTLFPRLSSGFYTGTSRAAEADMIFASVQSLGRLQHLKNFSRDYFDYVVVDEFHHATSRSYQQLLDYFTPQFLLGLTATPERTDQADILSLCDNNLVFERSLVHGIEQKILVPFHYHGIYDEFVDYQEIPWRHGKFDPSALEHAFATQKRAKHIFRTWKVHKQSRTLGFCVSQRHADFMAEYFCKQGVRAVAVYAGSAVRRNDALQRLAAQNIEVIFSVDLFNEGTDIPQVDTILMTRPTESKILFLQQLGRGLRLSPATDKNHVVVLDFIGNHKSFLLKPASLLGTVGFKNTLRASIAAAQSASGVQLPDGCHLSFDLEIIDFWQSLVRTMQSSLAEDYESLSVELGHRPTATQFYHAGFYQKAKIRQQYNGWLGMVATIESDEKWQQLQARHGDFLRLGIEQTAMTKCFKAILLQAFCELGGFGERGIGLDTLAARCYELLHRYPQAIDQDLGPKERALTPTSAAWQAYWRKNPVAAFTTPNRHSSAWFSIHNDSLVPNFTVTQDERDAFETMLLELCELRMAEYVARG